MEPSASKDVAAKVRVATLAATMLIGVLIGVLSAFAVVSVSNSDRANTDEADQSPETADRTSKRDTFETLDAADEQASSDSAALASLRTTLEDVTDRVGALEERLRKLQTRPATNQRQADSGNVGQSSTLLLPEWEGMSLERVDWPAAANTLSEVHELYRRLIEAERSGTDISEQERDQLTWKSFRLTTYFGELSVPTHYSGLLTGESTHPAATINLLTRQLLEAGRPLQPDQLLQLRKLSQEYAQRWETLQSGYGNDTIKLRKILDEAELKEWFYQSIFDSIDEEQRILAVPPDIAGLAGFDMYSPGTFLIALRRFVVTDGSDLNSALLNETSSELSLETQRFDSVGWVFSDWARKIERYSIESGTFQARFPTSDQLMELARHQTEAYEELVRRLTGESFTVTRQKLCEYEGLFVPAIVRGDDDSEG